MMPVLAVTAAVMRSSEKVFLVRLRFQRSTMPRTSGWSRSASLTVAYSSVSMVRNWWA